MDEYLRDGQTADGVTTTPIVSALVRRMFQVGHLLDCVLRRVSLGSEKPRSWGALGNTQ